MYSYRTPKLTRAQFCPLPLSPSLSLSPVTASIAFAVHQYFNIQFFSLPFWVEIHIDILFMETNVLLSQCFRTTSIFTLKYIELEWYLIPSSSSHLIISPIVYAHNSIEKCDLISFISFVTLASLAVPRTAVLTHRSSALHKSLPPLCTCICIRTVCPHTRSPRNVEYTALVYNRRSIAIILTFPLDL